MRDTNRKRFCVLRVTDALKSAINERRRIVTRHYGSHSVYECQQYVCRISRRKSFLSETEWATKSRVFNIRPCSYITACVLLISNIRPGSYIADFRVHSICQESEFWKKVRSLVMCINMSWGKLRGPVYNKCRKLAAFWHTFKLWSKCDLEIL